MRFPERWSNRWCQERVIEDGATIASYIAYPVFEGLIKSICRDDFYPDGTVKSGRTVQILPPGESVTGDESETIQVNKLGDLLWHFEQTVAANGLSERMRTMRQKVADFYDWDQEDVYGNDGLSGLRNRWLHGQELARAEFGTVMNYVALLIWGVLTGSVSFSRQSA